MTREKVILQAENFQAVEKENVSETAKENSQTENGVFVKGLALPFGEVSRNGVEYEKESVKEAADDLVGRTMLFNHKQDFGTGHVLNVEVTEDGMYFEGDINPNAEMPNGVPVAEAIERGDIPSVSIQAFVEELDMETEGDPIVDGMETKKVAVRDFVEISPVTVAGFTNTSALPEHLQEQGVVPVTEMLNKKEDSSTEGNDDSTMTEEDGSDGKDQGAEENGENQEEVTMEKLLEAIQSLESTMEERLSEATEEPDEDDDEEDDEDDDDDEEESGEPDLEEKVEELREEKEELNKRIEKLLEEDEGKSKQGSPDGSVVEKKPSFRKALKQD